MSWINNVQQDFVIQTGDGKEYRPKWILTSVDIEFNVSLFNFPNTDGTLVYRGTPMGAKHELSIVFDGDNHLDVSESFRISTSDKRAWTVSHPLYGTLTVQPIALKFDNSFYNATHITGSIVETITDDRPKTSINPVDKVNFDSVALQDFMADSFAGDVQPDVKDVSQLQDHNLKVYTEGAKRVKLTLDAEKYFNLFNTANAAVLNATSEPLAAIRAVQALIMYPSEFTDSVYNRLDTLQSQFDLLRTTIDGVTRPSSKRIYENNVGSLVSAMAVTSSNPQEGDYRNRNDVIAIIAQIIAAYNNYLADLDSLQTTTGGDTDSYIPDVDSLSALSDLVYFTVSNLFEIALSSKQERTLIVEEDTNVILLAHRLYGLAEDDSTIDTIINNNDIGLNELLGIRKGRKIIYYV